MTQATTFQVEVFHMDFALATKDDLKNLFPTDEGIDEDIASGQAFLPSIKIIYGTSGELKDRSLDLRVGDWFLTSNNNKGLGNEVDIVICDRRWHARQVIAGKKTLESYHKDDTYMIIVETGDVGSYPTGTVAYHGSEFLLWLPGEKIFVTYHPGRPSTRRFAGDLKDFVNNNTRYIKLCTKITSMDRGDQPCPFGTPIGVPGEQPAEQPSEEEFTAALVKFKAPVYNQKALEEDTSEAESR